MERELFSLVCCLLRLVSLFRESSLISINHNGTARTVTQTHDTHTDHTHTESERPREGGEVGRGDSGAAHFFVSPSRVLSCVSAVCVCTN